MNRKTIIVIGVIVILIIAGWLFYYFGKLSLPSPQPFFGNLPIIGGRGPISNGPPDGKGVNGGQTAPGQEKAALKQIIDKDILSPALSADKKSIYYILRENGHILTSDLDGNNSETLTNLTILESFDGFWSPLKTKIAIFYHENGVVKKFLEETATGTPSRFLPQSAGSFAWSPDGKSMAYLTPQGNQTNLIIADQNNKNGKTVFSTPVPDFTLRWISKNSIILVSRPSGLAPSLVIRLNLDTRRSKPVITGARGVVLAAVPDGSGFILSRSSDKGEAMELALYSLKDDNATPLNITTVADKCVFSSDSKRLFCGAPKGVMRSPSPDEWYKGVISLSDRIVAVDVKTGETSTLMENEADVDVIAPFVSPDGQYLFFQDKKDGTLWRLELEQ